MTVDTPCRQGLAIGFPQPVKRKIFVSFHHSGDQIFYNEFSRIFHDGYQIIFDNSVERKIDSDNSDYVIRYIRENFISGSSCTIVLVGPKTWGRKFVDWEISATLDKQHGLIGLQLPNSLLANGQIFVPDRLLDNINSGYALWKSWSQLVSAPTVLGQRIEESAKKSRLLISNSRQLRGRNA